MLYSYVILVQRTDILMLTLYTYEIARGSCVLDLVDLSGEIMFCTSLLLRGPKACTRTGLRMFAGAWVGPEIVVDTEIEWFTWEGGG